MKINQVESNDLNCDGSLFNQSVYYLVYQGTGIEISGISPDRIGADITRIAIPSFQTARYF